jgi:hypothetical protein
MKFRSQADSNIGFKDINPGDIVCFTAGEHADAISNLIVLLSGDPYSHAALVCDTNKFVEATPPKLQKSELNNTTRFGGRTITAGRLKGIDLRPLFEAADIYFNQGIPYGWGDLVMVGFLLLRKNPAAVLDPRFARAVSAFLMMAVRKSKKARVQSKSSAMFCSQFVYQCFLDAGHVLEINKPALPFRAGEEEETLLDLVIDKVSGDDKLLSQHQPYMGRDGRDSYASEDEEQIIKELYEALKAVEDPSNEDVLKTASPSPDLLYAAVIDFALAYANDTVDESFMKATLEKTVSKQELICLALNKVKEAKYVTPGDLTRIANANGIVVGSFEVKNP